MGADASKMENDRFGAGFMTGVRLVLVRIASLHAN